MTTTEKLASSIGKGLVAGLIGTAAMTVSSTVAAPPAQAKLRASARHGQGTRHHLLCRRDRPGAVQRPRALGLRHRLGSRARPAGRRRPAAPRRNRRACRRRLGKRAGGPARPGHRPALYLLGTAGDRDRRLPPHRLCHRDRDRLRAAKQQAADVRRRALTMAQPGAVSQAREQRMNLRPAPDRRERVCPRLPGACTRSRPEQPLTSTEGAAP